MAERRKKLNVGTNGSWDAASIQAKSRYQLYQDDVPGQSSIATWLYRFFSFSGMYAAPSVSAVLYAGFREMLGSAIISMTVGLVAFFALGLNVLLAGLLIAAAYGGAFFLASRLPADDNLRGHYNGAITAGYLIVSRIGSLGAIFYMACQVVGGLVGGCILLGALSPAGYAPAAAPVVQATVPLPTSANSSFATAFGLEFGGSLIIVIVLLVSEFLGTDAAKPVKNYRRAMTYAAVALGILVVFGYPFQVFTYSNTAYFGALFANAANWDAGRHMADLAQLCDNTLYPTSVFNPLVSTSIIGCSAWAHYYFTPILGGVIGGLVALVVFMLRYSDMEALRESRRDFNDVKRNPQSAQTLNEPLIPSALQSPAPQLASPFHKTK